MITVTNRAYPDWMPTLAQAQGFLLDALDANRAGRYSQEQVDLLERRGRSIMQAQAPTAYGLLGISLIGFLLVFFGGAMALEQGVVPGPEWCLTPLSPLALLVFGGLALRSIRRPWQNLRRDLMQNRLACVEGPLSLQGPPPAEACRTFELAAGQERSSIYKQLVRVLLAFLFYEMSRPSMHAHDSTWGKYFCTVEDITFEVNPQAWCLLTPFAGSRVRVFYVPGYKWIVNMEPMPCL